MKFNGRLVLFTLILIALQTICKLIFAPQLEWSGFSPFIAIALFSGFIAREKNASFLLPLVALLASDAIIHVLYLNHQFDFAGFYPGMWKNYLVLLLATLMGWGLRGRSYATIAVGAIAAPSLYFILSNFMVWQATSEVVYTRNFAGLMNCYDAGLPFYRNSLIATVLFLPAIMLMYNYILRNKVTLKIASV